MPDLLPVPAAPAPAATTDPRGDLAAGLALAFLASKRTERTRQAYAADLRHWFAWCDGRALPVLDARRVHVDAYARELEQAGRRPATVARRLATLAGFYRYARAEDVVPRSPVEDVDRPPVGRESPRLGLDRDESRALLAAAAAAGPRDETVARLLLGNGLRASEAAGLRAEDVGSERGHVTVRVRGKGGREDVVPLPAATADALARHLSRRGRAAGPLFANDRGGPLTRHNVSDMVARLGRVAGIAGRRVRPHDLRHAFVTHALDAGATLRDVQDSARHADPRTTRRYDRGRGALDRHAAHLVAHYLA